MKEISDIVKAYHQANAKGIRTALATVVSVEGSSYRRPGARMLVTEEGVLTGAISGGCLEGDALKKALLAIHQQENKLITYDTSDDADANIGIQLGCNGIVHILFEPIDPLQPLHPLMLLEKVLAERRPAALVTLFSLQGKLQTGTTLLYRKHTAHSRLPLYMQDQLIRDAELALSGKATELRKYARGIRSLQALIDYIPPPQALMIIGAGNDTIPLARLAELQGWEVHIADGRATHAIRERFPMARSIVVAPPAGLIKKLHPDHHTAVVLMTHNYAYDLDVLRQLSHTTAGYVGILGPGTKRDRMLQELEDEGIDTRLLLRRLHGPVGLDIGAETAEEIALSICAEIKAVFSNSAAKPLKEKNTSIHKRNVPHRL